MNLYVDRQNSEEAKGLAIISHASRKSTLAIPSERQSELSMNSDLMQILQKEGQIVPPPAALAQQF